MNDDLLDALTRLYGVCQCVEWLVKGEMEDSFVRQWEARMRAAKKAIESTKNRVSEVIR